MHEVQSAAADANWKSKQEGKRKAALAYKQLKVHMLTSHSPLPYTLFFPFWIWDNELSPSKKINESDTGHYIGIRQAQSFLNIAHEGTQVIMLSTLWTWLTIEIHLVQSNPFYLSKAQLETWLQKP